MNRAEKRKKAKAKPSKKLFSPEQRIMIKGKVDQVIEQNLETIKEQVLKQGVHDLTAAFMMSLSHEFGFGRERMIKLLKRVNEQFECIISGNLTVDDIKEFCESKDFDYEAIFKQID